MNRLVCLVLGVQLALFAGDNEEALLAAARKGDLDSVKALCQKGASLETKTPYGQTPLYLAAIRSTTRQSSTSRFSVNTLTWPRC